MDLELVLAALASAGSAGAGTLPGLWEYQQCQPDYFDVGDG